MVTGTVTAGVDAASAFVAVETFGGVAWMGTGGGEAAGTAGADADGGAVAVVATCGGLVCVGGGAGADVDGAD